MTYPTLLVTSFELSKEQRQGNDPDVLIVQPEEGKQSISIEQVHQLLEAIVFTPVKADHKTIVITPAHLLTLPAQQALLKTLEEPPTRTQFVLESSRPNLLLPTIISRCVVDQANPTPNASLDSALLTQIQQATISECIDLAQKIGKDRENALIKTAELLSTLRQLALTTPTPELIKAEKAVVIATEQLAKNVNVRLVLENLFFQLRH